MFHTVGPCNLAFDMNKIIFSWKFFLVAITWAACERPLNYQLNADSGIPVFYGILCPDETPQFQLFETLGALDTGTYPIITNAEILLIENQTDTIPFVYNQSQRYEPLSVWRPKMGRSYRVEIKIPGHELLLFSSEVMIPTNAKVTDFEFVDSLVTEGNNGNGLLTLTITPPVDATGLYFLEVEGSAGNEVEEVFPFMLDIPQEIGSVCDIYGEVFSDRCFESSRKWKWRVNTNFFISGQGIIKAERLKIELSSVSEDYFEYLVSRRNQVDGFEALFIRADQVHSNIDGGLGILGARQVEVFEIEL